jgi:hypothetical protein
VLAQDLVTSATTDQQALEESGEERLPSPMEFTVKMGALLRVFTTVVDSLADNLSPAKNKISTDFSCKVILMKIIIILSNPSSAVIQEIKNQWLYRTDMTV